MSRNVEIKARVRDRTTLAACVAAIADGGPSLLEQEDTFFHSPRGRLKLRRLSAAAAELIYYERVDSGGPKVSQYLRVPCPDAGALIEVLARSLGVRDVVRKRRILYHVGQTRIHLDAVEHLGDFLELEVVLRDDQDVADGVAIARDLMQRLGVKHADLIAEAYIDLLPAGGRERPSATRPRAMW